MLAVTGSVEIVKRIRELLMDAPIIAAVKDNAGLQKALASDCRVIFLLYGTILNIDSLVKQVHNANKICFVHIDLVEGLSNRDIAVDGLVKLCHPDGIISTRTHLVCRGQQLGLLGIQRTFMLDSISLQNLLAQIETTRPDFIEILPGIIPTVIQEIREKTTVPLIAGGLIRRKQDVIQALQAGVIAVSTSCRDVWEM